MTTYWYRSIEEADQVAGEGFMAAITKVHPKPLGQLEWHDLSESVSVTKTESGPFWASGSKRVAASKARENMLFFCVHMDGPGRVQQHERGTDMPPGGGVMYEARDKWQLAFPANFTSVTLGFPRELLPIRSAAIADSCARLIDPQSPAMRLLAVYIGQLHELAGEFSAEQKRDAGQAAIELLTMAFRDLGQAMPDVDGAGDVLLQMMRRYVRDHLADRDLTVEKLARQHHVSVRRAHALFGRIDATPGAFVREQRLLAARALLSDPRRDGRAVPDIAAAAGFAELRTFERAFRRQYGMTPAQWRRERSVPRTGT